MYILLICVLFVLAWVVRRVRDNLPPAYPGWLPIIGHLHLIMRYDQTRIWEFYKKLSEETTKKGGVTIFSIGPDDRYFITDPDDAYTAAQTCLEKHYTYNLAKPWLGEGLFTADGAKWKAHRKIMNMAFTPQLLNGLLSVFNQQSRRLLQLFDVNLGSKFRPDPLLENNNLETIYKTTLGVDATEHKKLLDEYAKSLHAIFAMMFERFLKVWLHSDYIFYFSSLKTRQDRVVIGLHELSNMVLQKRKAMLVALKGKEPSSEGHQPLMDTVLKISIEKGLMTDREVRENLDTIIFAGHDTSANSLTYTLILLGSDQKRQEKVFEEISEVIGDLDRDVDKDDLSQLVYLEAVIKESLRLYPIAPCIPRVARTKVKLKNCILPAGTTAIIDVWGVHRHSTWGPDAEEFKPERWLDLADLSNVHKAYGAFGVGKRTCIGRLYAMMSMKVTLVHILRRYKVTADIRKLTLKMDSLLRPQSGQEISIKLRKKTSI